MKMIALFFLLLCAFSGISFAEHLGKSGNEFLVECSAVGKDSGLTDSEMTKNMVCMSYVEGLVDGIRVELAAHVKGRTEPFCFTDVTSMQLLRVTLKFIRENPEQANLHTAVLMLKAWEKAFPCGGQ